MAKSTLSQLPKYLRVYVTKQDYELYTARDHAAWRYIMRQNREFFKKHAVDIYLAGLKKTGIPIDRIPKISDMDKCLRKFGWGAVPVSGFIPPSAFLDFQARRVLPIATQMRRVENIAYTPAPDIVHEAAGHAPIIADKNYRQYLSNYAAVAQKTIMSREDLDVYEAIRVLSDIKENPQTKPAEIDKANRELDKAYANVSFTSEATKVGRMAWWTVEYGLIQSKKQHKIFGAGLLSSVGESQNCLASTTKKVPLTLDNVEVSYDITKPQPQLFVAKSWKHLSDVLTEFEDTLAFRKGGRYGLDMAIQAQSVNTVVLDSGVEVSGYLKFYDMDKDGNLKFIEFSGPTQLSIEGKEIAQRDPGKTTAGSSSPLGKLKGQKSPYITKKDAKKFGLDRKGKKVLLEYESGYRVEGTLKSLHWHKGRLLFADVKQARCFNDKGVEFDIVRNYRLAFGSKVPSVYGGASCRDTFGDYDMGQASTNPGRQEPFSAKEKKLIALYQDIRDLRAAKKSNFSSLEKIAKKVLADYPTEWLIGLEILELATQKYKKQSENSPTLREIENVVLDQPSYDYTIQTLIERGLALKSAKD